jgi:hypothetical protein
LDTLETCAFLDVSSEPMVMHIPETGERYYSMAMLDAYSNVFASPGKRTTGTEKYEVAIVGPNFSGFLPPGMRKIKAPTDRVWLIGRTQIRSQDDLHEVVELTKAYTLTPLSAWGKAYTPPSMSMSVNAQVDMETSPVAMLAKLSDRDFFDRAAALLKRYPPPASDKAALERFSAIGLTAGQFTPSPEATKAVRGAGERATQRIKADLARTVQSKNVWRVPSVGGKYGTHYDDRAALAMWTLGTNLREDAIYPFTKADSEARPLDGNYGYLIHFDRGAEPPANAFWSVTMYDHDGHLVDNPIDRHALGSQHKLKRNPDGSLDLWIQHGEPASDQAANWLPAPEGRFQLMLRVYWPREDLLSGRWAPPPVQRVKD